eukprot:TRINITY_DN1132_c0_g1_i1.p1 TRINITY_DN1132_c0_g1~~TRINITY_DN1132_c0_g1_i1.p1  ORF type:complete len:759 (-),score=157.68 TRINITY_DN1132_c0_g1_i1:1609-3828(-)
MTDPFSPFPAQRKEVQAYLNLLKQQSSAALPPSGNVDAMAASDLGGQRWSNSTSDISMTPNAAFEPLKTAQRAASADSLQFHFHQFHSSSNTRTTLGRTPGAKQATTPELRSSLPLPLSSSVVTPGGILGVQQQQQGAVSETQSSCDNRAGVDCYKRLVGEAKTTAEDKLRTLVMPYTTALIFRAMNAALHGVSLRLVSLLPIFGGTLQKLQLSVVRDLKQELATIFTRNEDALKEYCEQRVTEQLHALSAEVSCLSDQAEIGRRVTAHQQLLGQRLADFCKQRPTERAIQDWPGRARDWLMATQLQEEEEDKVFFDVRLRQCQEELADIRDELADNDDKADSTDSDQDVALGDADRPLVTQQLLRTATVAQAPPPPPVYLLLSTPTPQPQPLCERRPFSMTLIFGRPAPPHTFVLAQLWKEGGLNLSQYLVSPEEGAAKADADAARGLGLPRGQARRADGRESVTFQLAVDTCSWTHTYTLRFFLFLLAPPEPQSRSAAAAACVESRPFSVVPQPTAVVDLLWQQHEQHSEILTRLQANLHEQGRLIRLLRADQHRGLTFLQALKDTVALHVGESNSFASDFAAPEVVIAKDVPLANGERFVLGLLRRDSLASTSNANAGLVRDGLFSPTFDGGSAVTFCLPDQAANRFHVAFFVARPTLRGNFNVLCERTHAPLAAVALMLSTVPRSRTGGFLCLGCSSSKQALVEAPGSLTAECMYSLTGFFVNNTTPETVKALDD